MVQVGGSSHIRRSLNAAVPAVIALACLLAAAPALAAGGPPVNKSRPSVAGSAVAGSTLTGNRGSWEADPPAEIYDYDYVWQRCTGAGTGCVSTGRTGTTYALGGADRGRYIRFVVTAKSCVSPDTLCEDRQQTTAYSSPRGPVASNPPNNASAPTISGTLRHGSTLTASPGRWSSPTPTSYTYHWLRCDITGDACGPVPGATGRSYKLTGDDVSHRMRVAVRAGHPWGTSGWVASSATSIVRAANPSASAPDATGLRRLSPFPRISIAGRLGRRGARLMQFVVRGPRRALVRLRCRGRGCPYRAKRFRLRKRRMRVRSLERSFRAGAVIEVRITGRNRIGKFTRIRIRRGRVPARADRCLVPGTRKPQRCRR